MKCWKVSYENLEQARLEAQLFNERRKKGKKKMRAYKCQICSKHHLTKLSKGRFKQGSKDHLRGLKGLLRKKKDE
jgi:hypothetical protein